MLTVIKFLLFLFESLLTSAFLRNTICLTHGKWRRIVVDLAMTFPKVFLQFCASCSYVKLVVALPGAARCRDEVAATCLITMQAAS
jgi:hypothetical protein